MMTVGCLAIGTTLWDRVGTTQGVAPFATGTGFLVILVHFGIVYSLRQNKNTTFTWFLRG